MAKSRKAAAKPKARKASVKSKPSKTKAKAGSRKAAATPKSRKAAGKPGPVKASAESPTAVRLTFSYKGDDVRLVSQQPVNMTVPPSDSLKGYKKHKGFWAELKGAQDQTLYRRVLHNPTRNDAEVFSDDPEQSISRAPAPKRTGVFVVVVPATEAGHELTLSRSAGPPAIGPGDVRTAMAARALSLAAGPAEEIARFKLKK
jgi:hypothetical protein